jgi:hypothetical protein
MEILNLKRHKKILDQRLDMFMKIFTIDNINNNSNIIKVINKDSNYENISPTYIIKDNDKFCNSKQIDEPSHYNINTIHDIKTISIYNNKLPSYKFKNKRE